MDGKFGLMHLSGMFRAAVRCNLPHGWCSSCKEGCATPCRRRRRGSKVGRWWSPNGRVSHRATVVSLLRCSCRVEVDCDFVGSPLAGASSSRGARVLVDSGEPGAEVGGGLERVTKVWKGKDGSGRGAEISGKFGKRGGRGVLGSRSVVGDEGGEASGDGEEVVEGGLRVGIVDEEVLAKVDKKVGVRLSEGDEGGVIPEALDEALPARLDNVALEPVGDAAHEVRGARVESSEAAAGCGGKGVGRFGSCCQGETVPSVIEVGGDAAGSQKTSKASVVGGEDMAVEEEFAKGPSWLSDDAKRVGPSDDGASSGRVGDGSATCNREGR